MTGCIYHEADLDGVMSAAIVKKYFKGDIDLLPYNYGKEIPDVKVINMIRLSETKSEKKNVKLNNIRMFYNIYGIK